MNNFETLILTDLAPGKFWSRSAGPYRLASELRLNGFSCKVINGFNDFDGDELFHLLENFISEKTLFIGISTTFLGIHGRTRQLIGQRTFNLDILESVLLKLKKKYPKLKLIQGGAKAGIKLFDIIDYQIGGYADSTLIKIANNLRNNTPLNFTGNPIISENGEFSFPQSKTMYAPEDAILPDETLVLEITRGCRFRCKFCSYPLNGRTKQDYYKNPDSLKLELITNYEKFGVTKYILSDDTYNETPEKIEIYMKVFESLPFKIQFSCYQRLDLIERYPKTWDMLLKSGLRATWFGIESYHDKSAFAIGKALGGKKVLKTLEKLKSEWGNEVTISGSFIVGLPYDTEETLNDWLSAVTDSSFPLDHVKINPLNIHLPSGNNSKLIWKSEFDLHPEKYGYKITSSNHSDDYRFDGIYWESPYLNSRKSLELADYYLNKYYQRPIRYDSFSHLTIMGYGLTHKEAYNLRINNSVDSHYLDCLIQKRIATYKKAIKGANSHVCIDSDY